jgi:hypothetical protein
MQILVEFLSILLLVAIVAIYIRSSMRRTWDLLSWRNLFLLGFIHFYCLSAYFTASGDTLPEYLKLTLGGWAKLAITMASFLLVFVPFATLGLRRPALTKLLPKVELPITSPALITSTLVLSVLAIVFSIPFFNYFGVVVAQIRGQLGACALGLATYYLIARRFNPLAWLLFLSTLGMAAISSTVGLSGRRLLLGVMLAAPWMWYFTIWRYRNPASNLIRLGVFFILGILGIIIYSPFRDVEVLRTAEVATIEKRVDQFTELLTNPKIDPETIKYILYADTVPNTLYVLENYPGNHPFMPFHGVIWFLSNPIPRALWPNKPDALGIILKEQMNVPPNLGPGIIAHGWSEGWFFGVLAYAAFFGLLCGVVDRACAQRCWNPYFLAVFGANLGNVVALPRGDTPLFMIQITGGIVSSCFILYLLKPLAPVWASFPSLVPPGTTVGDALAPDTEAPPEALPQEA